MAMLQSQGQSDVKMPHLEDPEDYHLYVAYSEKAEDKQVAQRIITVLKKIKCFDSAAVDSSEPTMNGIQNGVDHCKAFLFVLSKSFTNGTWLKSLCKTMQRKAEERYHPNATIVVRVGNLDDVTIPSFVADVIRDGYHLDVNEADFVDKEADFVGNIYKFLSQITRPKMDVLPVSNVAIGLAWSFYYGYLQIVLPDLPDRIGDFEETLPTPGERVMPRKAFVIVPYSCFCPTSLSKADNFFEEMPHIRIEAARAGSPKRPYDMPVYKLLGNGTDKQTYYVQVQFATPILTMYEMYKGQLAGLRQQELYHQMRLFCYYVRTILSHPQTSPCHDKAIIICHDLVDNEQNMLSRIVRDRIKLEIDREEWEAKSEQDATPIPDSAEPTTPTFVLSDPNQGRQLLQCYAMESKPRGKALILSVRKHREGSKVDEGVLEKLWKDLEFEVDLKIDPTAQEMADALASIQTVDHSQYSAFVCCILAHGCLGTLMGSDCTFVKITDLTYLLYDRFCESLAGKPKMFFIQSCQSDYIADSMKLDQSTQTDMSMEHDASLAGTKATLVPGAEDFLMSYATLPGFKAPRDAVYGTIYIDTLNEKIRKLRKEHDMDLESILKHVSTEVKQLGASVYKSEVKQEQFPFCLTTMNKLIFL